MFSVFIFAAKMSCIPCNNDNNNTFTFVDQKLSFQRAQRVCEELYDGKGQLATFEGKGTSARAVMCCEFDTKRWIGYRVSNRCFDQDGRRTLQPVSRNTCTQNALAVPNATRYGDRCFALALQARDNLLQLIENEGLQRCKRKFGFVCEKSFDGSRVSRTFAMTGKLPSKIITTASVTTQIPFQSNQVFGTEANNNRIFGAKSAIAPTRSGIPPTSTGINIAAIAGGAAGIFVLLLLVVAYCLCRRKKKSKPVKAEFENSSNKQSHHLNEWEKDSHNSNTKSIKHIYVNESKVEYVNVPKDQQYLSPKPVETDLYLNGTPGFPATVPTVDYKQSNRINSTPAYANENAGNYLQLEYATIPKASDDTYEELIG